MIPLRSIWTLNYFPSLWLLCMTMWNKNADQLIRTHGICSIQSLCLISKCITIKWNSFTFYKSILSSYFDDIRKMDCTLDLWSAGQIAIQEGGLMVDGNWMRCLVQSDGFNDWCSWWMLWHAGASVLEISFIHSINWWG